MEGHVSDVAAWGALIGTVLPFLIAVVSQPRWSKQQRQIMSVAVSIVAGIGTVLASGQFDPINWVVTIAAVIGAAQASYAVLWKPTGVAPAIENATNVTGEGERGESALGTVIICVFVILAILIIVRLL